MKFEIRKLNYFLIDEILVEPVIAGLIDDLMLDVLIGFLFIKSNDLRLQLSTPAVFAFDCCEINFVLLLLLDDESTLATIGFDNCLEVAVDVCLVVVVVAVVVVFNKLLLF